MRLCGFRGYGRILAFSSGHSSEVELLYLQLELINIEEQLLKLQMLKRRRQRRRSQGWSVRPAEAEERVNLQHWL